MPMAMMPPLRTLAKSVERRFLHRALLGGEENKLARLLQVMSSLLASVFDRMRMSAATFSLGLQFQQIRDAAALGGAAHVGNLMHALDIDAAGVGEEHQVIVRAGGEEMLDEILVLARFAFARGHADDALAAAPLRAIGTERSCA